MVTGESFDGSNEHDIGHIRQRHLAKPGLSTAAWYFDEEKPLRILLREFGDMWSSGSHSQCPSCIHGSHAKVRQSGPLLTRQRRSRRYAGLFNF